jgi:cytochrome P450
MTFAPERWLGDEQYAGDDLAAAQPFSTGARSCIGKVRLLCYYEV